MGAQQIVPAILVNQVGSLAVDGDILLLVTLHTITRLGVELDESDGAEISTIADPHTTRRGVKQYTWVDSVLIFHTVGRANLDSS